ncbi:MAG: Spy/CpxP family protein refolding chaperone [Ramlibacter sp.]
MKFAHTHFAAAGLLAATLGFAAIAQTPATAPGAAPAGAHQGHRAFDPAKMQERIAKRQGELKQKLQITAGQEAAWTSFTTAMKPGPRPQHDRAAIAALSTPDRIDQMRALRNQRIADMDRRADATKAFYAVLTADQKKVFDAEALHHGRRGHGHGHGHHKG